MRRIVISAAVLLAVVGFVVLATGAANGSGSSSGGSPTFKVELDNAFGLNNGEQMKVAGVPAGKITKIDLCYTDPHANCQNPLHALVTVNITYKVGSRYEDYGETGMAHLLEHLVFKGTPKHPNIPREITEHGAREACEFVKRMDFKPSAIAFDAQFDR